MDLRVELGGDGVTLDHRRDGSGLAVLLRRREGLSHLAVVTVDGDGLDPQAPGLEVQSLHLFDRGVLGHVHRLRDGARDEGLDGTHHLDVAEVVDGVVTHRAGEDLEVLGLELGRPHDRLVLVDVGDDVGHFVRTVPQTCERARHRLIDDGHVAATDQLLELHETQVRLDTSGVAVHQETDGAGRREHRGLRVAHTVT